MRVMMAVMPFAGHVAPMRVLVTGLISRGHVVRVYTGARYAASFEAAGARVLRWSRAPDFDENRLDATFPELRGRKGPRQLLANLEHLFIRTAAQQAEDLAAEWRENPWDLLVSETTSIGAPLAAELLGVRWASVSIAPLALASRALPPLGLGIPPGSGPLGRARNAVLRGVADAMTRPLTRALNQTRATVGLGVSAAPFFSAMYSPGLLLATGGPTLDYRRPDPPAHLHYVGNLARAASTPLPEWWPEVEAATVPIVHVTQGTQNVDAEDLVRPALEALSGEEVLVVASTGIAGREELPFPVPPNVHVGGFVPHGALLPRCSLVITNGGWGGVLNALGCGIPLIVAGGDLDKPEVAARVAWSGAGINLRTGNPSPRQVGAAYRRVGGDPSFRDAAAGIASELAGCGGADRAVELLEDYCAV